MYKLSQVLDVPVGFFYEGMNQIAGSVNPGMAEENTEAFLYEFLNSRDGLELNRAFVKVSDPNVRKSIIDLVRSLGRTASKTPPSRA